MSTNCIPSIRHKYVIVGLRTTAKNPKTQTNSCLIIQGGCRTSLNSAKSCLVGDRRQKVCSDYVRLSVQNAVSERLCIKKK